MFWIYLLVCLGLNVTWVLWSHKIQINVGATNKDQDIQNQYWWLNCPVNCKKVINYLTFWLAALDSTHAYWVELSFSYNDTTTMIRGVKGRWDPGGVKHTSKNFLSSAWGQADFQGRRNVMTQATCGNVVGLCLGSSSEWASLWIRGSQQYIKTGHDRERHRTDSDIVFLLKAAFPLSLVVLDS